MANTNESGNNRKSLYIIIILLLILTNAYFIYEHFNSNKKIDAMEVKRKELDSTLAVVSDSLKAKIQEYEQQKGLNHTLDSTIDANIASLQAKQGEIDKLLKEKNWNAAQYNKAKKEIVELRKEKDQFIARIDSLSGALKFMSQANDSLNTKLKGKIGENEQLKTEKQQLSKKVQVGSLLKPSNVVVTGIKVKGNGKEVETNSAKKAEKLKICFDVPDNQVADAGSKTIMLRIQDPQGTTIAIESEGSGIFVNSAGEQKQYTKKATFDYDNKQKNICIDWKQTNPYSKGDYKVEFYQDGVFLSEGAFKLK